MGMLACFAEHTKFTSMSMSPSFKAMTITRFFASTTFSKNVLASFSKSGRWVSKSSRNFSCLCRFTGKGGDEPSLAIRGTIFHAWVATSVAYRPTWEEENCKGVLTAT